MPCQSCSGRPARRTLCFQCHVAARRERQPAAERFDPARPLRSHTPGMLSLSPREIAHRAAMLAHLRDAAGT